MTRRPLWRRWNVYGVGADVVRKVEAWLRREGKRPARPPAVDLSWWPLDLAPLVAEYGSDEVTAALIAVLKNPEEVKSDNPQS